MRELSHGTLQKKLSKRIPKNQKKSLLIRRTSLDPSFEFRKLATWDPVFLSYELLHLYGRDYLQQISVQLKFPIDYNNPELNNITEDDTNSKYFKPINYHPTDDLARHASRKWK